MIQAKYKICQLASLNCCEGRVHGCYGERKWSDTCDRICTQYSLLALQWNNEKVHNMALSITTKKKHALHW